MPRPASTDFADAAYEFLAPVAEGDEALGWPLLQYVIAVSQLYARVEAAVRSPDGKPAGSQVLDVDRAPTEWLPWLAQFVGQRIPIGATDAEARAIIRDEPGFQRGMVATLIAAVQATLNPTSTRYVAIVQRVGGNAGLIQVNVRTSQVLNAAATLAAALGAKRAGLVLTVISTATETYGEWETTWSGLSYTNAQSPYATYAAAEAV